MVLNYMTFFKLVFLTAACFFWSSCGGYHFAGKAVPPDLRGRYCSARSTVQCCPGRNDQCSVPILRTVCYCDTFCNRTIADCCPDFWGYCLNMDPPYGAMTFPPNHPPATKPTPLVPNNCHHEGRQYTLGDKIHWNCNNCTCVYAPIHNELNWKCTQKICLVRGELLTYVNKKNNGWTASNYTFLWGLTLDEGIKYKLGTFRPDAFLRQMTPLRVPSNEILPETFDAREQWPWWVHGVVDQGNCGASWAFSTTSVAADRLAIHSLGALREELSTQHLLSCDTSVQKGCNGGYLDSAWWFMRRTGVVSKDCYPYKSGSTNSQGRCGVPKYRGPTSRAKCPGTDKYRSIIYKTTPPYRIAPLEREIMKEIMLNGPVQATMEVREDFFMYRGGVYQYSLPATTLPPNYRRTGFHSVRIIGWGKDKKAGRYGLKYWLCANSWGRHWGEDGYFRILKGADECKIESFVIGVWGRVLGKHIINKRQASTR